MAYGRFHTRKSHRTRNILLVLCVVAGVLLIFDFAVRTLESGNVRTQEKNLSAALERDITDCYATTGEYPQSLDEIREKYGLVYDEELFFVDYQVRGANLRPDVTIITKRDGMSGGRSGAVTSGTDKNSDSGGDAE